ncbi:A disintegrin and metalloproteinase with thrombospondin motifs 9-like isoform X2 [Tubulanus polymorphus]|uniref:A disintegrin and metalloproteinase with thrombospondin motifs 9-like isoform X2 n=1 Tax=Tubulanus polymorphus TaxID=672921 RepID=UPI003DA4FAF9
MKLLRLNNKMRVFAVILLFSVIHCSVSKISQHFGASSNSAVRGPYIAEHRNISNFECVTRCLKRKVCLSFNVNETLCQLSSKLPDGAVDLRVKDGTIFQFRCAGDIYCNRYDIRLFPNRCKHLVANGITEDGTYQLYLNGIFKESVAIYCYNMSSKAGPKEYLTLPAGKGANYAITSKPNINPYRRYYDMYSESYFSKIRLNLDTLYVINDDFTFADTSKRLAKRPSNWKPARYGEAKSCSKTDGAARINLSGTGYRIAPGVSK